MLVQFQPFPFQLKLIYMKRKDFANKIHKEIVAFEKNMENLGKEDLSPEEWMKTYLNWTEWTTDMHDMCWKHTET